MESLIIAFVVSFFCTLLVIRYQHLHDHFSADHDLTGVQKFLATVVPRIGGVSIMIALIISGIWIAFRIPTEARMFFLLTVAASPAFLGGLIEDCTKRVGVMARLGLTMLAAVLGFWLLGAGVYRLDMPFLDAVLKAHWVLALMLTAFAVSGVANAVNIIDGYNGLAGMVSIIILGALGYVAFALGDVLVWKVALATIGGIMGFLFWNYPRGLIFLGDGGAYLIGFVIGELSVLLVARHPEVSPWFPLLVVVYPVFETLFSIYRKKFVRGRSPGQPDGVHMHMLIYKRLVRWAVGSKQVNDKTARNAMTSPYLWLLCSLAVVPAVLFWRNPHALQFFVFAFTALYIFLYRKLVRFKSPKWLLVRKPGYQQPKRRKP